MEKERNEIRKFSTHLQLVVAINKVVDKMMVKSNRLQKTVQRLEAL